MTLPTDRLQEQIERVVAATLPRVLAGQLAALALWQYRVTGVVGATPGAPITVSGVPVDPVRCPFGPLPNIQVWRDSGGGTSVPIEGSIVVIGFHDGNPAKPAIVQMDPTVPSVPPPATYVGGTLSLVGALTTFASPISTGAVDPGVKAAALGLLTALAPLL